MRNKKKGYCSTLVIVALLGIFTCGLANVQAQAPKGLFKMATHWSVSANWFDPATGTISIGGHLPLYFYHDALVKSMPEGTFTFCLAESYTISRDAKVAEFKLRKGVKFHNGDPLTAEDVVFSFGRYKGPQASLFRRKIEKVVAVDPHLVRIHFNEPFPDFLEYLAPGASTFAWIVPKNYVEKVGDAEFKKHPIGCGPYKFVEFVPGVRFVGEAFEGFWRKVPNIKRMEFWHIPEPATRLTMVKRGEMDIGTGIVGTNYENAMKDPTLKVFNAISPNRLLLYITAQWDPKSPWSDPRVRKAASLAIDRQTLADVYAPGCSPIGHIALEGDPSAIEVSADPFDPEQAKKLLAEAGYPKGFSGGKFWPYNGRMWPYGEQIATNLKAVGISLDTLLLDTPAWHANREGGRMKGGLFVDSTFAPTIGGRLAYLFGAKNRGYGGYSDIDAVWNQHLNAVVPETREDLLKKVQNMIYERTMWIPLTSLNSPAVANPKRIKGNPYRVQPMIYWTAPLEDIELVD